MTDPKKAIFAAKKSDAKRKGIVFTLDFESIYWPTHCPVLGLRLQYGRGGKPGPRPDSPSFDRYDAELGYVPGNVTIISNRANTIKHNAERWEIEELANWMREQDDEMPRYAVDK